MLKCITWSALRTQYHCFEGCKHFLYWISNWKDSPRKNFIVFWGKFWMKIIHSYWDVDPLFCSSFRPPPPPVSGLIKHENRIIGPSEQPLPPDPWVNYYQTRMNCRNLRISRCDSISRCFSLTQQPLYIQSSIIFSFIQPSIHLSFHPLLLFERNWAIKSLTSILVFERNLALNRWTLYQLSKDWWRFCKYHCLKMGFSTALQACTLHKVSTIMKLASTIDTFKINCAIKSLTRTKY